MTRRICILTGTRADFGLLRPLIQSMMSDPSFDMKLIVTGSHLSPEFGMSVREIEDAGIPITRKIEILSDLESALGVNKSAALALSGIGEALNELKPDIFLVLGDRYEALSGAFAALIAGIPVAHLHGGEITEGAIDDSFRHAITKIASLHFAAAEPYRNRIVQMGEAPHHVFLVGGLGVDAMLDLPFLDQADVERRIGLGIHERTLLATFHPETADVANSGKGCAEMLAALADARDLRVIFTLANADEGGRAINAQIEAFVAQHPDRSVSFPSLGSQLYFSCLKLVKGVIGNSSSGLLEAPSFCIGTVNIGSRQKGRLRSTSVIDCAGNREAISNAIARLLSPEFQSTLARAVNPYGSGGASAKILDVLKTAEFEPLRTKSFRDIRVA